MSKPWFCKRWGELLDETVNMVVLTITGSFSLRPAPGTHRDGSFIRLTLFQRDAGIIGRILDMEHEDVRKVIVGS